MKPLAPFAAVLALAALTGCNRHGSIEYARLDYCRANPGSVELFIDQQPTRPYRVVGVVDAPFAIGAGHRVAKMQLNACRLGADAIIDQSDAPEVVRERVYTASGAVLDERVVRPGRVSTRGLAIQYTDVAPAAAPVPAAPPPPAALPEQPPAEQPTVEAREGNIQIQTRGAIQIQAPSVEFRTMPAPQQAPAAEAPTPGSAVAGRTEPLGSRRLRLGSRAL